MKDVERHYVERSVSRFRAWLIDHEWLLGEHDLKVARTMIETATSTVHVRIMKLFFENVLLPQAK